VARSRDPRQLPYLLGQRANPSRFRFEPVGGSVHEQATTAGCVQVLCSAVQAAAREHGRQSLTKASIRRHLSYANIVATMALVLAMGGSAIAPNHYLITSTKQIKSSVLKKLKGNAGAKGATGAQGAQGNEGKAGTNGSMARRTW